MALFYYNNLELGRIIFKTSGCASCNWNQYLWLSCEDKEDKTICFFSTYKFKPICYGNALFINITISECKYKIFKCTAPAPRLMSSEGENQLSAVAISDIYSGSYPTGYGGASRDSTATVRKNGFTWTRALLGNRYP